MSKNIFVYADWESLEQPTLIGCLTADLLKGKEIFSFLVVMNYAETKSKGLL